MLVGVLLLLVEIRKHRSEGLPEFYISVERRIVDLQLEIGFRTVVIRTGSTEGERTASQERGRGQRRQRREYSFLRIHKWIVQLLAKLCAGASNKILARTLQR